MEVTKKVCRWCTKKFEPRRNQQRYCDQVCAYSGRKKAMHKAYLNGRVHTAREPTSASVYGLNWAKDNDLDGLHLGKECYVE